MPPNADATAAASNTYLCALEHQQEVFTARNAWVPLEVGEKDVEGLMGSLLADSGTLAVSTTL